MKRYCIERYSDGRTFTLKDWEHPDTPQGLFGKPSHIPGRFSFVGPLREDYTRFNGLQQARDIVKILTDGDPSGKYTIRTV